MMLRDRITRQSNGRVYRAHVWSRTTAAAPVEGWSGERLYFETEDRLRAMVAAGNYTPWATNEEIRWRGRQYVVTGVEVARQHGRDHHYLLSIELDG